MRRTRTIGLHAWVSVSVAMLLGVSQLTFGQARVAADSSSTASAPLVTANFVEPVTPVDWQRYQTPQACLVMMERMLGTAIFDQITRLAQQDSVQTARRYDDDSWRPLPPSVVTAGQDCVRHLQVAVQDLPEFGLSHMLRVAIGINNDSLVQAIVARQIANAGSDVRARAQILADVISQLTTNKWKRENRTANYRTASNVRLAQQYATQLDALDRPETLLYMLRAKRLLDRSVRRDETNINFDAQLTEWRVVLKRAQQLSLSAIPASDQREVHGDILGLKKGIAQLTYFTTPSHANLTHWLAVRDSVLHEMGFDAKVRPDSLEGKPAPQITGDYWFNTATPTPVVPAPGQVSLLVFVNLNAGVTKNVGSRVFGELRRLHTMFPELHIVLVAATQGSFRGKYLMTHPDSEAALIHHYFDTLQVPGILCVSKSTYRTVVGGQAIPLGTPVLDAYKLDPRNYSNRFFLVDAQGWVVSQDLPSSLDDEAFIRRLLAYAGPRSASVISDSVGSDGGAIARDTIAKQDTMVPSPLTPDSVATPARRKPVRSWPWPTNVLFHGITLTTQQQDSIQRLIVDQKARAEEVSRVRRSHERSIYSAAQIDPVLARAERIQNTAMRKTNHAQFKAVLTKEQQRQFDLNVLKVEDEAAKENARSNWWW